MELLCELVPHAVIIAAHINPKNLNANTRTRDTLVTAYAVRQQIHIPHANTTSEAETVSDTEVPLPLLVLADEVIA